TAESHIILDAIESLPREIGVLIIEHDMDLVFRFAERITVLVGGAVLTSGNPQEIAANPEVRAVYLGQESPSSLAGEGGVGGRRDPSGEVRATPHPNPPPQGRRGRS